LFRHGIWQLQRRSEAMATPLRPWILRTGGHRAGPGTQDPGSQGGCHGFGAKPSRAGLHFAVRVQNLQMGKM